jgi:hypothetical protein
MCDCQGKKISNNVLNQISRQSVFPIVPDKSHPILTKSIADLGVTESLRGDFASAGFRVLQDALQFDGDTLVNRYGFSYHTITEMIALLRRHGLETLFMD